MEKASHLPEARIIGNSDAKTEESATKVLAKSGYPKTIKENIKLFLNLFINFFS